MSRLLHVLTRARALGTLNWWLPLAIFALSRVIDGIFVALSSHLQVPVIHGDSIHVEDNMPADPGYLKMLTNWDGQWYLSIADHGYPDYLPRDPAFGHVLQNSWAFFPLFPGLTRLLMFLTAGNFALAATILSTICSGLAMVLLFRMVRESGGVVLATLAVVSLSFSPAAVVFQAAYSEGIALLLIMVCLWMLRRQRYGLLLAAALMLSLARPVVGALAIVVALHWLHRRHTDATFTRRQQVWVAFVCATIAASFFLWIGVCGLVLGHADAYQLTQDAWAGWRWDQITMTWESWITGVTTLTGSGLIAVSLIVYFIWLSRRRAAAGLGAELRMWAPVYAFYVMAATRVTPSVGRYLMLVAIPWWPLPACANWTLRERRSQVLIGVVLVAGICLQYAWVRTCFVIDSEGWLGFRGYP
jgi:hypothetical protein